MLRTHFCIHAKKHVHTQINCFFRVYGRCESVCVINIAHCNNRKIKESLPCLWASWTPTANKFARKSRFPCPLSSLFASHQFAVKFRWVKGFYMSSENWWNINHIIIFYRAKQILSNSIWKHFQKRKIELLWLGDMTWVMKLCKGW